MKIIFDFDGTLLDSSERLYCLFNDLVPQSQMTKEEYWQHKRNKRNHKVILQTYFPEIAFEQFNDLWMRRIEAEQYLQMDILYPDTFSVLSMLSSKCELYLLTARQSRELLLHELDRVGILPFFREVLTTENKMTKKQLLEEYCRNHPDFYNESDYFVSDMGSDILLGNQMKYKTIAITHGFMSRACLIDYSPLFIVDELTEITKIIL